MNAKPIMLPISRGILEHRDRIGPAIWEFLWLVDKITEDVPDGKGEFDGIVLGGQPVSLARIAADLKEHVNTTQRNVAELESLGYIVKRRQPENQCAYVVTKSKKWFRRDQRNTENGVARDTENGVADGERHTKNGVGVTPKMGDRNTENGVANKETLQDSTKNSTKSTRARRVSLPEGFAISDGVRAWALEKEFDRLEERLEHFIGYAKANGKTYANWDQAFMNATRDDWAKLKTRGPNGNGRPTQSEQRRERNRAVLTESARRFSGADVGSGGEPDGVQRHDASGKRLLAGNSGAVPAR